jgi:transcriptional regulator with XRE-family HTH domain
MSVDGAASAPPSETERVGKALTFLRLSRGLKQTVIADRAGMTRARLSQYMRGKAMPRYESLCRLLKAMGVTMADLEHAKNITDTREPMDSAEAHATAVRLAQECGRAVAHCCLAFMELQVGGWTGGWRRKAVVVQRRREL